MLKESLSGVYFSGHVSMRMDTYAHVIITEAFKNQ